MVTQETVRKHFEFAKTVKGLDGKDWELEHPIRIHRTVPGVLCVQTLGSDKLVCVFSHGDYAEITSKIETIEIPSKEDGQLESGVPKELNTPKHYDNSKGTLYKVATERGWNPYLFDIVKRLERAEKKGEFEKDLEKSIVVIQLWIKESGQ